MLNYIEQILFYYSNDHIDQILGTEIVLADCKPFKCVSDIHIYDKLFYES